MVFILCLFLTAPVEAIDYPWVQFYDFSRSEVLNAGVECRDEGFALAGSRLIRTDGRGNVLWSRTYDYGEIDDIAVCYTGGFIMVMNGQVFRTDASGNILWNHSSGANGRWNQISNFALYSNGGYTFVGTAKTSYPCLVYVAENGEIRWNHTLGIVSEWYTIVECSYRGFTWTCEVSENSTYTSGTYLVHTSFSRIEEWSFRLNENITLALTNFVWPENESITVTDFIWVRSGGLALIGQCPGEAEDNLDVILIRTDSLGNQLWNQSYDFGYRNEYPKFLIECSNGGFAFCGARYWGGPASGPVFVGRVSADGTYSWTYMYTSNVGRHQNYKRILSTREYMKNKFFWIDDNPNDFFEVNDEGFAIVGRVGGGVLGYGSDGFLIWIPDMDPGIIPSNPPERPPLDRYYTGVILPLTELFIFSTVVILVWTIIVVGFYLRRKQQQRTEGESHN